MKLSYQHLNKSPEFYWGGFVYAIYSYFHEFNNQEVMRLISEYFTRNDKIYRSTLEVAQKDYDETPYGSRPLVTPSDFVSKEDKELMRKYPTKFNCWDPDFEISGICWPIIKIAIFLYLRKYNKRIAAKQETMYEYAVHNPGHIVV